MNVEDARAALKHGQTIVIVVGTDPEDPVCHLTLDNGLVYTTSVAGWSEGITECVCELDSTFLDRFINEDRHSVYVEDE